MRGRSETARGRSADERRPIVPVSGRAKSASVTPRSHSASARWPASGGTIVTPSRPDVRRRPSARAGASPRGRRDGSSCSRTRRSSCESRSAGPRGDGRRRRGRPPRAGRPRPRRPGPPAGLGGRTAGRGGGTGAPGERPRARRTASTRGSAGRSSSVPLDLPALHQPRKSLRNAGIGRTLVQRSSGGGSQPSQPSRARGALGDGHEPRSQPVEPREAEARRPARAARRVGSGSAAGWAKPPSATRCAGAAGSRDRDLHRADVHARPAERGGVGQLAGGPASRASAG
jgi:hypothetical protein